MWMSSCCTTLLLSARRAFGASISAQANAAGRLQSALDGVDPGGAPRVQVTFPTELAGAQGGELASLMVLDSSFNPPTRAHLHLLASSMERFGTARALLLLAKQNADKAVVGASLVQRLQMMELIAAADESGRTCCGLTGHPLFVDKAAALRALCSAEARVFMLVGFDTWIRITDPKYYAEGQMYAVLSRLLSDVDVVVASRDPAAASNMPTLSVAEQEAQVLSLPAPIAQGHLHFVSTDAAMAQQSSSAVRKALASGEGLGASARAALPECLHEFVQSQGLYAD